MKDDVVATVAKAGRSGRRLALGLGSRIQHAISGRQDASPEEAPPLPQIDPSEEEGSAAAPAPSPTKQLKKVRSTARSVAAELKDLTAERARLREERLGLQQVLGQQHGKAVMPRLRVEKSNGTPSFIVAQRVMQRVHRRALDPGAGLDNVGVVFADPQQTAQFARSHDVPCQAGSDSDGAKPFGAEGEDRAEADALMCIVHALKGEVALVEVRGPDGARHFDGNGEDVGDIRPAARYDATLPRPEPFKDICAWARVLSEAIPRPYAQLSFRSEGGVAALNRIDVDPDRIPLLNAEWDQRLGSTFDAAYSRFLAQPYRAGALDNRVPGGTFTFQEGA